MTGDGVASICGDVSGPELCGLSLEDDVSTRTVKKVELQLTYDGGKGCVGLRRSRMERFSRTSMPGPISTTSDEKF